MWHDVVSVITERKQVKDELRLLSEITANAAEGITLFKASDGTIHYANKRFEMLFGYAPDELMGKPTYILNAPRTSRHRKLVLKLCGFSKNKAYGAAM